MIHPVTSVQLVFRRAKVSFAWAVMASVAIIGYAATAGAQSRKATASKMKVESRRFAVVELFTSQSCSSCPSADENLADITQQAANNNEKIITLSFHVDYWNHLGWSDPYSTADATRRQRLYAGVHGLKRVYTPQMVINGTVELLGSNRDKARAAIRNAIKRLPRSDIAIATSNLAGEVAVEWHAQRLRSDDLLNVALVQDQVEDRVDSGENGGRTLRHVNVVRDFHVINPAKEIGVLKLVIPKGVKSENLYVVAYVQSSMDANIHAADLLKVEESP